MPDQIEIDAYLVTVDVHPNAEASGWEAWVAFALRQGYERGNGRCIPPDGPHQVRGNFASEAAGREAAIVFARDHIGTGDGGG